MLDAVEFVMAFMVEKLECLSHLKREKRHHPRIPSSKSQIVPLEILDIDEASTDNNIMILEHFYRDTRKEKPDMQVCNPMHCQRVQIL